MSIHPTPVILLHGLFLTPASMRGIAIHLEEKGYEVFNIPYPSRKAPIEVLARNLRQGPLRQLEKREGLCVVAHSMGGILLRYIQNYMPLPTLHRAVMLGPPNQGSEVADWASQYWLIRSLYGPALSQLTTSDDSFVRQLGEIDFPCGIIAGNRPLWPIFNSCFDDDNHNDGKVSVESTKIEGMNDWRLLTTSHLRMLKNPEVWSNVSHFLKHGWFERVH